MFSLPSPARAAARVITASEIAALRALRHKIVEPPDKRRERLAPALHEFRQPTEEHFHDEVERP